MAERSFGGSKLPPHSTQLSTCWISGEAARASDLSTKTRTAAPESVLRERYGAQGCCD